MSRPCLTVTRGLPAAGKTTHARAWVTEDPAQRVRVNRDDLRAMMFGSVTDYGHTQEAAVTAAQRAQVKALLASGRDVITDDTNLRPRYVREWARFARANGADFEVVEFPIDPEEAIARDAARDKSVGEAVIRKMVGKFVPKGRLLPIPDEPDEEPEVEPYGHRPDLPPAIIVDIDGTLALNTCGRSPYDLTRVYEDTPNRGVVAAVQAASWDEVGVIYLSGREDSCRRDTERWITEHVGIGGPLYMRASDDKRKDSIVKRELFDQHVRDRFDVLYVLDDRNQVVEMWRSLGLTVFQVAEGDF